MIFPESILKMFRPSPAPRRKHIGGDRRLRRRLWRSHFEPGTFKYRAGDAWRMFTGLPQRSTKKRSLF